VQQLLQASPRASLTLDFSRVRDVDWFALASLAASLAQAPPARVSFQGYSYQYARLLAYLGFHVDGDPAGGPPADWD
jgi:hypothetical protein